MSRGFLLIGDRVDQSHHFPALFRLFPEPLFGQAGRKPRDHDHLPHLVLGWRSLQLCLVHLALHEGLSPVGSNGLVVFIITGGGGPCSILLLVSLDCNGTLGFSFVLIRVAWCRLSGWLLVCVGHLHWATTNRLHGQECFLCVLPRSEYYVSETTTFVEDTSLFHREA